MGNTEVVHTRINSEIKKEANKIFNKIGLNMSQAIKLFLITSVNKNGIPFELKIPKKESEALKFAKSIATVDGVPPSKEDEAIFEQYADGKIDYQTYMDIIENKYKK